jgi:sigma-B regulation protein RsbU (phosphoserine phosphatase)
VSGRLRVGPLLVGFFAVAFGVTWALAGRSLFLRGLEKQNERIVDQAIALFDHRSTEMQARLGGEGRLMGQDPRLRSLLGTPGIDEATILDLLSEFARLTGAHVLMALAPTGKVIAVVGEGTLKGLDLSTSKLIKDAREQAAPITGVWTLGQDLVWVSASGIRFGDRLVGYLVHGYRFEQHELDAIHVATGAALGVVISGELARASPEDPALKRAFEEVARGRATGFSRLAVGGESFVGRTRSLPGALPPTDFVWLRAAQGASPEYEILGYLLWVPVLATLAFALMFGFQRAR